MRLLSHSFKKCLGLILGLTCAATALNAAISIGPSGNVGPLTFDATPAAADIATGVLLGTATRFTDVGTIDAGVQTVNATNIMRTLPTTATVPPGTFSGGFRRNTTLNVIQSRPTTDGTNAAGVLRATLQNDTGTTATNLFISYDFAVQSPLAGELPGFYVYYSLTGEPNSWVAIPELTGSETAGPVSATVNLVWPAGSTLHVLWADDNANGITDPSYTIDNLIFATMAIAPEIMIVQQPQSLTVNEGQSATFQVVATGRQPISYQWFKDGVAIPGATSATYAIPRVYRADAGVYSVQVSNDLGSQTSDNATLTVNPDLVNPVVNCVFGTNDTLTIFVQFSEIVTNANDPVHYTITPTDGGDALTVVGATYGGGAAAFEGNLVVLTLMDPGWVSGKSYTLSIGEGISDLFQNPLDPVAGIPVRLYAETIFAISESQIWTYESSGTDIGNSWREYAFDDTGWSNGPALLGFETAALPEPLRTPVNRLDANGAVIRTFYFRTHFDYAGPAGGATLRFRTVLDDAAAIYLNGAEIFRMRLLAGPLNWQTEGAGGAVGDANYEGPFTVCVTSILNGDNVIAVEVHQTGGNSSDMVWGMDLASVVQSLSPVTILSQSTGTNVMEPAPFTLRVVAGGSNPQYQWFRDGVAITDATNAVYSVTRSDCDVDGGMYFVRVSNDFPSSVDSATVTVNVTCDTTKPTVTCVYGTNDVIVITFSEVTTNAAFHPEAIFNYCVYPAGGSCGTAGSLALSSATYTSGTDTGTTVLLVIDPSTPRDPNTPYSIDISGASDLFENFMDPVTLPIPLFASPPLVGINATQMWRYDTSGTDRTNLWRAVAYDDSAWPQGAAVFDGDRGTNGVLGVDCRDVVNGQTVRTCITISNATGTAQIPAAYFRTHFNYSGPSTAVLCLRPFIDDGAVYYLNGVEVLRVRMPTTTIMYSTLATGPTVTAANFEGPYYVCVTNLVSGDNVLGVELHQVSLTSSDLTFGTELQVLSTEAPIQLTIVRGLGPNEVTVSWTGNGTLQQSNDLSGHPSGWSNVTGVTGNSYTTTTTMNQCFFRVRSP